MPQYYYLDESGDPGFSSSRSASSHFVLAMVQLSERRPLPELATIRHVLYLPSGFEFKYHQAKLHQKTTFFNTIQTIPFCVRAVVVYKSALDKQYADMSGREFVIEFVTRLVLRASEAVIADDVLILDEAPPAFRRALRIKLSEECRKLKRVRPFQKIISVSSHREEAFSWLT